jgi:hypothetical protein
MRDEFWVESGPADPLRLMLTRQYNKLEHSLLPEYAEKHKPELKAMYNRLTPNEQKMLRSIRARRALDSIDVFHAVMQHEWGNMTAREKVLMNNISTLTTRLQSKLQGLDKFD